MFKNSLGVQIVLCTQNTHLVHVVACKQNISCICCIQKKPLISRSFLKYELLKETQLLFY